MGWTNVDGFPHLLFPASARWVVAAAAVGVVAMIVRRNRVALFIAVMGGFSAAVICLDPQGKLYNVRFLPFWFLCLYLMAGYALAEVVAAVARWNRRRRLDQWVTVIRHRLTAAEGVPWRPGMRISRFRRPTPGDNPPGSVVGPLIALAAACLAVVPPLVLPAVDLERRRGHRGGQPTRGLGRVELLGLRRQARLPRVPRGDPDDGQGGRRSGVRTRHVGVRPVGEPVRHHHVAHAAALLDQRLRRLDGGTAVRIVGHHPVPLHQPERVVGLALRRGEQQRLPVPGPQRPPRDPTPAAVGGPLLPGRFDHGRGGRRHRPEPDPGGLERSVEHQLQRAVARHHLEGVRDQGLVIGHTAGQPPRGLDGVSSRPRPAG